MANAGNVSRHPWRKQQQPDVFWSAWGSRSSCLRDVERKEGVHFSFRKCVGAMDIGTRKLYFSNITT